MSQFTYLYHPADIDCPSFDTPGPITLQSSDLHEVFSEALFIMQPRTSVTIVLILPGNITEFDALDKMIQNAQSEGIIVEQIFLP